MKNIIIVVLSLFVVGCATQTLQLQENSENEPELSRIEWFVFGGLAQKKSVDANEICAKASKEVAKVVTTRTALDVLLAFVTHTIVFPKHISVYCTK